MNNVLNQINPGVMPPMFGHHGQPNAANLPGMLFPPPGMAGFPGMEQLFLGAGAAGIPGFHPGTYPGGAGQPFFPHLAHHGPAGGQFGNQFR